MYSFFVDEAICQLWWSKNEVDHAEPNNTKAVHQCEWQNQVSTNNMGQETTEILFLIML